MDREPCLQLTKETSEQSSQFILMKICVICEICGLIFFLAYQLTSELCLELCTEECTVIADEEVRGGAVDWATIDKGHVEGDF